jgi:hypothetical protein
MYLVLSLFPMSNQMTAGSLRNPLVVRKFEVFKTPGSLMRKIIVFSNTWNPQFLRCWNPPPSKIPETVGGASIFIYPEAEVY